jgi:hypothetical protein
MEQQEATMMMSHEGRLAALTEALRGLGWMDGRNIKLIVHRPTPDAADIRKSVPELLSARPDVVVSAGAPGHYCR